MSPGTARMHMSPRFVTVKKRQTSGACISCASIFNRNFEARIGILSSGTGRFGQTYLDDNLFDFRVEPRTFAQISQRNRNKLCDSKEPLKIYVANSIVSIKILQTAAQCRFLQAKIVLNYDCRCTQVTGDWIVWIGLDTLFCVRNTHSRMCAQQCNEMPTIAVGANELVRTTIAHARTSSISNNENDVNILQCAKCTRFSMKETSKSSLNVQTNTFTRDESEWGGNISLSRNIQHFAFTFGVSVPRSDDKWETSRKHKHTTSPGYLGSVRRICSPPQHSVDWNPLHRVVWCQSHVYHVRECCAPRTHLLNTYVDLNGNTARWIASVARHEPGKMEPGEKWVDTDADDMNWWRWNGVTTIGSSSRFAVYYTLYTIHYTYIQNMYTRMCKCISYNKNMA